MEDSPTIRYARQGDVSLILRFIRQGAEDQAPGTVPTATEEALANTLHLSDVPSSPTQIGWPLLIFSPEGTPAGLLIYFYNLTTWQAAPGVCMEELYVAPEFRSLGYARMLVEAMTGAAKKAGCVKMEWNCLSDNQRALRFYGKLGAEKMETWDILKVGKEGIERLAVQGAWDWA
jgi:GNAT superfamily N-acetyltransferase